jgi:hypothetical protein
MGVPSPLVMDKSGRSSGCSYDERATGALDEILNRIRVKKPSQRAKR